MVLNQLIMPGMNLGRAPIVLRKQSFPAGPLRRLPSHLPVTWLCPPRSHRCQGYLRHFSASIRRDEHHSSQGSFLSRLRAAWNETRIQWYPIPVGLGIGFIGLGHFYRVQKREQEREDEEEREYLRMVGDNGEGEQESRPKRRKRIRPSGPW
jgi:phosphatidylserine decarboxylase